MYVNLSPSISQTSLNIGCGECGEIDKKLMKCAQCKIQFYCSRDCQKKHWPKHKKVCISSSISSGDRVWKEKMRPHTTIKYADLVTYVSIHPNGNSCVIKAVDCKDVLKPGRSTEYLDLIEKKSTKMSSVISEEFVFSGDGNTLVSNTLIMNSQREVIAKFDRQLWSQFSEYTPVVSYDGAVIAFNLSQQISIFNRKGEHECDLEFPQHFIESRMHVKKIALSPDGTLLAAGLSDGRFFAEATLAVFDVKSGKISKILSKKYIGLRGLEILNDKIVVAGFTEGEIIRWQPEKDIIKEIKVGNSIIDNNISNFVASPQGTIIYSNDKGIYILDWDKFSSISLGLDSEMDISFENLDQLIVSYNGATVGAVFGMAKKSYGISFWKI